MRSTKAGLTVVIALALGAAALAYWVTSGAGSAAGAVGTLTAPTITGATSPSNGSASITWSPAAMTPSSASSGITYVVQRKDPSAGSFADLSSGGCSGTKAYSASSITCTDATITAAGSYQYRVIARYDATASWSATSTAASVAISIGSGTITLAATTGHVGDTVSFTGSGFPGSSVVSATFDGSAIAISPSNRMTTGGGAINSTSFTVPATTAGAHTLTVSAGGQSANATFTVTPKITLSQAAGVAGMTVSASGTGFAASRSLGATFAGSSLALSGTTSTNSSGSFNSASFTVPNNAAGSAPVVVTDAAGNSDTAAFTINTPSISLTTSSGTVGAGTTVSGSNFPASSPVTVSYDGASVGAATTDASGAFSAVSVTIPASASGAHSVTATVVGRAASATYTVSPSITLTPTSGVAGSSGTIAGTGFGASKPISATFGGAGVSLTGGTSDATGSFSATYTVPNQAPGSATVVATDSTSNSASASFTIPTPSITLTPNTGHVGDSVAIAGSNFPAGSTVSATFGGSAVTLGGTTTTSASGDFSAATFAVPVSTAGAKTAVVTVATRSASSSYTVTPAIAVSPASGFAGGTVSISGSGFAASSALSATFGGSAVTVTGTTTTNTSGSFTGATITVPSQSAGSKDIVVTAGGGSGTATYTLHVRGFTVTQQPTAAIAGTAPATQVTLTATLDGATDTSYSGNTLSWSGTGAANSPSNASPTLPTSPGWSNGQAAFPITLVNAGADSLSVSDGSRSASFATITVAPGTINKLAWNSFAAGTTTTGTITSSNCLFTCTWSAFDKNKTASFKVAATDAFGNIGSGIGTSRMVSLSHASGNGTGNFPASVTIPATGLAVSGSSTYTSDTSGSWTSETITGHATTGTLSDVTATINRQ